MKKLILVSICCLVFSCQHKNTKPIEKYYGKDYVLIDEPLYWSSTSCELRLKSLDTIISVYVHPFDIKNLKVGDTIK